MPTFDIVDFASLPRSVFYIMLVLADGERHGYEITKQVLEITDGEVKLGSGTLYRQLHQMVANGWITEKERSDGDARRRYYALTARGRRVAAAEARRLQELVRVARGRRLLLRTQ